MYICILSRARGKVSWIITSWTFEILLVGFFQKMLCATFNISKYLLNIYFPLASYACLLTLCYYDGQNWHVLKIISCPHFSICLLFTQLSIQVFMAILWILHEFLSFAMYWNLPTLQIEETLKKAQNEEPTTTSSGSRLVKQAYYLFSLDEVDFLHPDFSSGSTWNIIINIL